MTERGKLGGRFRGVNSQHCRPSGGRAMTFERATAERRRPVGVLATVPPVLLLTLATCTPPRTAPTVETGTWAMALGGVARAGYADEPVPGAVTVAWREGVGRGITAPLLVNGPVVVAATTSRSLVSLSADDGGKYWDHRFGASVAGSPVRAGRRVFVATRDREGRTFAIDLARGRRIWSRRIGAARFEPLLVGEHVVVATEARELFALHASSGETAWRARFTATAAQVPVPHGDDLLVATTLDTLYRVETATGRITARAALPATPSAPLVLRGDTLFAALHSGEVIAVDARSLAVAWRAEVGAPVLAPIVAAPAGDVYALTRTAEVWRVAGGRAERLAALGGAASGALTLARDRLLVGRLDGTLFLLDTDGRIIWQVDFDDSIVAPAAVYDGAVFVPLLHGDIVKLR
jgi:outer membrane protein assembly factor BamB